MKIGHEMAVQPYCGPYWAPELWGSMVPTAESEVWAFAATLLESCVGHDIFARIEQMVRFDSSTDVTAMASCPSFKEALYFCTSCRLLLRRGCHLRFFFVSSSLSAKLADES